MAKAKLHQHPMKRLAHFAVGRIRSRLCACGHMLKEHYLGGCRKCESFKKSCDDLTITGMHGGS